MQGGTIHAELGGHGPAVVLLHDELLDSACWDAQTIALTASRTVVRLDARGHGRSPRPNGAYVHSEDVRDALWELGVDRATVAGIGLGSVTAIDLALRHPDVVERLVLVAPAIGGVSSDLPSACARRDVLAAATRAFDPEAVAEAYLRAFVDGPMRVPDELDRSVRDPIRAMVRRSLVLGPPARKLAAEPQSVRRLGELEPPVVALAGQLDGDDVHEAAQLLVERCDATLMLVPGAGRLLPIERPAVVSSVLLD